MREASGRYVALDGKLWKTLVALLLRPGYLTREYLAGRRRRYIGSARLFLVSSLVVFAMLRFASESIEIGEVLRKDPSDKASALAPHERPKAGADQGGGLALDHELNIDLGTLPESIGALKKRIERFNRLSRTQKIEQIVAGLLRYGPYAMFVLLPAFALLLKLAYLGRRRWHARCPCTRRSSR